MWKLKTAANAVRMKLKSKKRIPVSLLKEILIGEHSEDCSFFTDEEKAQLCTPEIQELGPSIRRTVARLSVRREGQRLHLLEPGSSPKRGKGA